MLGSYLVRIERHKGFLEIPASFRKAEDRIFRGHARLLHQLLRGHLLMLLFGADDLRWSAGLSRIGGV